MTVRRSVSSMQCSFAMCHHWPNESFGFFDVIIGLFLQQPHRAKGVENKCDGGYRHTTSVSKLSGHGVPLQPPQVR